MVDPTRLAISPKQECSVKRFRGPMQTFSNATEAFLNLMVDYHNKLMIKKLTRSDEADEEVSIKESALPLPQLCQM